MLTSGAFEERRTSEGRLLGLRILFIGCFAALAVAFWLLQFVRGAEFRERADCAALPGMLTLPFRGRWLRPSLS